MPSQGFFKTRQLILESWAITASKLDRDITFFSKKEGCVDRIHNRFTADQVKVLLRGYCQRILDRPAIEKTLGISKSTFSVILREYRHNPEEADV
jgi:hypothetical protein